MTKTLVANTRSSIRNEWREKTAFKSKEEIGPFDFPISVELEIQIDAEVKAWFAKFAFSYADGDEDVESLGANLKGLSCGKMSGRPFVVSVTSDGVKESSVNLHVNQALKQEQLMPLKREAIRLSRRLLNQASKSNTRGSGFHLSLVADLLSTLPVDDSRS